MTPEEMAAYLLSLPERAVRSATALAGGLTRELGDVSVPAAIRRTRLYQSLVDSTLRFLIEQVGQVEGVYSQEGRLAEDFAMRRTAGNGIELVGILTFRASPVWVMAALADLSGVGRLLVQEICESLKQEGLLDPNRNFETVDQMLDGLESWAGRVAEAINTPPLDVGELRREWAEISAQARGLKPAQLPSTATVRRHWDELKQEAARQERSVFELSSLMALATVTRAPGLLPRLVRSAGHFWRRTGRLFSEGVLDHYAVTLKEIHETGYLAYWTREMRPYLQAAADQFSPSRSSLTQGFLRR